MNKIADEVKEIISKYIGKALGQSEQRELYKEIQRKVACSEYRDEFKTVFKSCMICGLEVEYHNSSFEDWKILTIFDSEESKKQGLISYSERELHNKKNYLNKLKLEVEKIESEIESYKKHINEIKI